jgi:hypothetical protein
MNISIIQLDEIDLTDSITKINPCRVFTSTHKDYEKKFADIALQLDEYIYLNSNTIDLIYVVRDNNPDHNKILNCGPMVSSNAIYFTTTNHTGSFFCSPHVFSLLGSLYKINIKKYFNQPEEIDFREESYFTKMFYLIDRLGIDIYVI